MALAALTQKKVADMVEAAALLSPISYLGHISSHFVQRAVSMHLDQVEMFSACNLYCIGQCLFFNIR